MASLLRTSLLRTSLLRSIKPKFALTRLNLTQPISRGFITTSLRFNAVPVPKDTQFDKDLAAKLEEELIEEKEHESERQRNPEFIKTFLEQNPFKIEDKPGVNEVVLTRTFGNEKIRLMFDINADQTPEPLSYPGDDEDDDDTVREDITEDEGETSLPARCSIIIEKAGKGALTFELIVADGVFLINYVSHYNDTKLASDWTAEADWKRRGFYPGPIFETLDNQVQVLFEKYLEERGINTAVAMFIPNYIEYKEQKEYFSWLVNVKKFVESP